ncbi:MAG: hypothetical protein AB1758_17385 [Candidatus Eremiobacterota bacterium]
MLKPIVYRVDAEFDGRRLHSAGSGKGEAVRVAALDATWDRDIDLKVDEILFRRPTSGPVTKADLEAYAEPGSLNGKSLDDLRQEGFAIARDSNADGVIVLNPTTLGRVWAGLRGRSAADFLDVAAKEAAAAAAHRVYRAEVDAAGDGLDQKYVFNPTSYQGYVDGMKRFKLKAGVGTLVGLGTFALAYTSHATGAFALAGMAGLLVGWMSGMCLMMSTFQPGVFNPKTEAAPDWSAMHPEGFRWADYEQRLDQAAMQAETQANQLKLGEYFKTREEVKDFVANYLAGQTAIAERGEYVVIGGVRVKSKRLVEMGDGR